MLPTSQNTLSDKADEYLLPIAEVSKRIGFAESTIFRFMKEGRFPKPVSIGTSKRWKNSDVEAWIQSLTTDGKQSNIAKYNASIKAV